MAILTVALLLDFICIIKISVCDFNYRKYHFISEMLIGVQNLVIRYNNNILIIYTLWLSCLQIKRKQLKSLQ